jgi:hypothetical protein
MFVLSRNVSASFRVIATLVATAVVLWATGVYHYAEAANITTVSDVLSDSDNGVDSNHLITFTLPTSLLSAETIVINFDSANGFDFTGVTTGDFAITATGGTFSEAVNTGTDTITFTSTGGTVATSTVVTVTINGTNKINNPSVIGSYEIDISAGTDSGHTRVAIVDNVLVTAKVDTTFTFTVSAQATSTLVNGQTTTRGSSSTTIPFGTLTAGVPQTIGQRLNVQTNAINGFVVTVVEDQHLLSSTGADIDNFENGNNAATPATWSTPSNSISDEKTWGHWGVTSSDNDTTRTAGDEFGANEWQGVSTTPQVLFSHTGPADGTTSGIGSTTVGYRAQITALQEAADDYNTILTYVATPTF